MLKGKKERILCVSKEKTSQEMKKINPLNHDTKE